MPNAERNTVDAICTVSMKQDAAEPKHQSQHRSMGLACILKERLPRLGEGLPWRSSG